MTEDGTLLTRHYALEYIVMQMLGMRFSAEALDDFAANMRADAEVARATNRQGASMTRATGYGMNAPLMDTVAEILGAAADLSRPPGDVPAEAGGSNAEAAHDGNSTVVSLFPRTGQGAHTPVT
jgi:hypothetical protein